MIDFFVVQLNPATWIAALKPGNDKNIWGIEKWGVITVTLGVFTSILGMSYFCSYSSVYFITPL
jgi:hypothetical protein